MALTATKVFTTSVLLYGSHAHIFQFLDGAESMQSYFINNIRKHARDIFPVGDVGKGAFAKGYKRSDIPEIVNLLRNLKRLGEMHPRYPSILYKDSVIVGKNIFGSSTIVNVSPLILFVHKY